MIRRVWTGLPVLLLAVGRLALPAVPAAAVVGLALPALAATPRCGDGIVQPGPGHNEQCDEGDASNGTTGSCCTADCQFQVVGTACDGMTDCAAGMCNGQGACLNLAKDEGTACTDDGNDCTDDVCDGFGDCGHPAKDVGAACTDDGNDCTTDVCDGAGTCEHPAAEPGAACADDANACTNDVCDGNGTCTHPDNDNPCDDGLFCNGPDTCAGGSCSLHAGDPCAGGAECANTCDEVTTSCFTPAGASCTDDGNPCTNDACDGAGTCAHPANTAPCDDGFFCNGADTCADTQCSQHAGDPCAGGAECANTCTEATRSCFTPAETPCADDANPCTNDACNGAGACAHPDNTAPCSDDVFCNGTDTCGGGSCSVHSGDPCATGPECNNTCQEATTSCLTPAGAACADDANPCTDDACNGDGQCTHPAGHAGTVCRPSTGPCDIADACTGTSVDCPADARQPDETPCDDGVFCNGVDTCAAGVCAHAGDPCLTGSECNHTCNEAASSCLTPEGTECTADADVCTADACDGEGHCAHPAIDSGVTLAVSDADDFTDDFCVDLTLSNCSDEVSLLQGTLHLGGGSFELTNDAGNCGNFGGFLCKANQATAGGDVKFVVFPAALQTCIPVSGASQVGHLCFHDLDPVCSGLSQVALDLTDLQGADCAHAPLAVADVDGTLRCGGLRGDCDADGDIDIDDLFAQADEAISPGIPSAQTLARCDDDCDSDVDIFDMSLEIDAILNASTPPLECPAAALKAAAATAGRAPHVGFHHTAAVLASNQAGVRGVQLTFVPRGGPVHVLGVATTRRTDGFTALFRQTDPNGPIRVIVFSLDGKTIPAGKGRIVKLLIDKTQSHGRLRLVASKVAAAR
jgi:hypothetical protein